jgi:hypothetical protein
MLPSSLAGCLQANSTASGPINNMKRSLEELGLYLNEPEPAVICRHCRYALQPAVRAVSSHLQEKHGIPAKARRALPAILRAISLPDPNSLPCRPDWSAPHPFLVLQPGAACRKCGFLSTSQDLIQRHLTKAHNLQSDRRHWLQDGIRRGLSLQSWTQNGSRKYWIAHGTIESEMPAHATPRRRARLEALHQGERDRIHAGVGVDATTNIGVDDLALISNWMHRTAWAQTFRGADRSVLLLLSEGHTLGGRGLELGHYNGKALWSSVEDERVLAAAECAVDWLLDCCEDTARHTDHSVRCWLRSQIPGRPYRAPFELPGRKTTQKRYRTYLKRFVCFVLRLYRMDSAVRVRLLSIQLSRPQLTAIEEIWGYLSQEFLDVNSGSRDGSPLLLPQHQKSHQIAVRNSTTIYSGRRGVREVGETHQRRQGLENIGRSQSGYELQCNILPSLQQGSEVGGTNSATSCDSSDDGSSDGSSSDESSTSESDTVPPDQGALAGTVLLITTPSISLTQKEANSNF